MGGLGILWRFFLIGLVIWILYRTIRKLLGLNTAQSEKNEPKTPEVLDVMVQDPVCGTYFPQKEGIRLRHKGSDLYFCSKKCMDDFLADPKP